MAALERFASWLKGAESRHIISTSGLLNAVFSRLAKELNMATVVTVHLPICQRHTLMLHGQEACDGKIDQVRCSHCCSVPRVYPVRLNNLSRTPIPVSLMAGDYFVVQAPCL